MLTEQNKSPRLMHNQVRRIKCYRSIIHFLNFTVDGDNIMQKKDFRSFTHQLSFTIGFTYDGLASIIYSNNNIIVLIYNNCQTVATVEFTEGRRLRTNTVRKHIVRHGISFNIMYSCWV